MYGNDGAKVCVHVVFFINSLLLLQHIHTCIYSIDLCFMRQYFPLTAAIHVCLTIPALNIWYWAWDSKFFSTFF